MEAADFEKTKELIAKGYLKEAFQLVGEKMESLDIPLADEVVLLHGQFNRLEQQNRLNLGDTTIELNKVVYGFLSVLDKINEDLALFSREDPERLDVKKAIIKSESRLLHQIHQELFAEFKVANQQLIRYLDNEQAFETKPFLVKNSIGSLLSLKEKMDQLRSISAEDNYEDPALISRAKEKIAYLQNQMNLSEIDQQTQQTAHLIKAFGQSKWSERLPFVIFVIVGILLIVCLTVLLLRMN